MKSPLGHLDFPKLGTYKLKRTTTPSQTTKNPQEIKRTIPSSWSKTKNNPKKNMPPIISSSFPFYKLLQRLPFKGVTPALLVMRVKRGRGPYESQPRRGMAERSSMGTPWPNSKWMSVDDCICFETYVTLQVVIFL